ncbi:inositol-pentakisphosphate 2-kinase [Kryptolebias marmoratus]|uniref:inositol-pentakisphosphate 2-kinase n=1 Tax=Kryptolebias marmoratus TaxID=37003 RepID=UPI0018ACD403|nr:inositol-pentakisphosphate 2-kinase [Kryptolebias marmoratus]
MELDKMDENDWKYHGEGNKSLVVSHVQLSRVLRLLKYPAEDSENPPQTVEQAFRQIQNMVDFSSNVMSSLLGDKFVHSGEVVKLPLDFVRQLSIKIQHQRPGEPQTSRTSKTSRTFKHLMVLFLLKVLVNALLSGGGGAGGQVTDKRGEGRSFCQASLLNKERIRHGSQGLPSDSVLFRILQTQMLDTLNIEGLYPLYRQVEQHLQDFPKERTWLQIDGPYGEAFLEKLQKFSMADDGSVEFAAAKVHQYRVAMTAKDCSIMVALMPSGEEEEGGEDLSSQRRLRDLRPAFSSSVSILDLDPKPFDSIPRQLRLDQAIVSCYLRTGGALPKGSLSLLPNIMASAERDDCTLLFHHV